MVRRLVHVQVAAGQEKMQLDILKKHLQFPGEPPLQGLAPSQGLSLVKVQYLENIGDR